MDSYVSICPKARIYLLTLNINLMTSLGLSIPDLENHSIGNAPLNCFSLKTLSILKPTGLIKWASLHLDIETAVYCNLLKDLLEAAPSDQRKGVFLDMLSQRYRDYSTIFGMLIAYDRPELTTLIINMTIDLLTLLPENERHSTLAQLFESDASLSQRMNSTKHATSVTFLRWAFSDHFPFLG
jgi:hypothetical protein